MQEEVKTLEHSYPKITFKKPAYAYLQHKANSRLQVCRKTVVKLVNARLPENQAVSVIYDQQRRKDRLTVIVDKKWGNQLYSKKGIGSWLNIAYFLKQHFESVDLNAIKQIKLTKPRSDTLADNVFTEKNRMLKALFVNLVSSNGIILKTPTGGFKVILATDKTSTVQNNLKLMAVEKERLRAATQRTAVSLTKDRLVEIYFLRQMMDPSLSHSGLDDEMHSRDDVFESYFNWNLEEFTGLSKTHTSMSPVARRNRRRRVSFKPRTLESLGVVPEAESKMMGKHRLIRIYACPACKEQYQE